MAEDQGQVRVDWVQGFHLFASGMDSARRGLGALGDHPRTDLRPPPSFGEASAAVGFGVFAADVNEAVGRLADWATRADRDMAGLAFAGAWIGNNFPETDGVSAERMTRLMTDAQSAAPPVPPGQPDRDPDFDAEPDVLALREDPPPALPN